MDAQKLIRTARALVAEGKGILAADESAPTIKKRFDAINVESTEENRRFYRELLFTAPEMEHYISGVILFEETLYQKTGAGQPFPSLLHEKGVIPGIKVDKGAKALSGFPGEKITEGLDGLRDRLNEYAGQGAGFAKWRAVITIDKSLPTRFAVEANAHALARYAALCQEANLVPIVEPEILMDGDHDIKRCEQVTAETLHAVFNALFDHRVLLEGMLLKPNMIVSGNACPDQAGVDKVAESTLRCFRSVLPPSLPGVVFLSGGQSGQLATQHLNAMNREVDLPWEISFSFGRALQESTLKAWSGKPENKDRAQKTFLHRARLNGAARYGRYTAEMEDSIQ